MITYGLRNPCAALVLLLCGLTDSYAYDASISEAYTSVSLPLPSTKMVVVCHGFGCTYRTAIGLSGGDRAKLAELLATGRTSADAERHAVATGTAWFDRRVGPAAGTTHRIARAGALPSTMLAKWTASTRAGTIPVFCFSSTNCIFFITTKSGGPKRGASSSMAAGHTQPLFCLMSILAESGQLTTGRTSTAINPT